MEGWYSVNVTVFLDYINHADRLRSLSPLSSCPATSFHRTSPMRSIKTYPFSVMVI